MRDDAGGRGHDNIAFVSLYGSAPLGALGLSGVLSYAHGSGETQRATGVGNADADRDYDDVIGAAQLTAPFRSGGFVVTPAVGVSVSALSSGSFAERFPKSSAFALRGAPKDLTSASPYATVNVAKAFVTSGGVRVTPAVLAGYRYDSGAGGQDVLLTAADGTGFTPNRAALSKSTAVVGAGLSASQGRWTADVRYQGALASRWTDSVFTLSARLAF